MATNYPGSVFDQIPKGVFNYGGGGINGSGAVCGNFNAGAAILRLLGAPSAVMTNYQRWFENTYLPSNAAYLDYRDGGWVPAAGFGGTGVPVPLNNAPKVKPLTLTCHGAHARWKDASSSWLAANGAGANTDRCSKTTYDACAYLCNLINDWKAGIAIDGSLDPSTTATGCNTPGCHKPTATDPLSGTPRTGVGGTMKCEPCHTERMTDGHNL